MFVGFFLRRIVTVTLCAGAFWAGVRADDLFAGAPAPAANCTEATLGN